MTTKEINFEEINFEEIILKFDALSERGLSKGLGDENGQMCIEAVICSCLGLPHGDDPGCIDATVRKFKIRLNDKNWSSPQSRAIGLRDLGIAQIGSKDVISGAEFTKRLIEKTIKILIPTLFRETFRNNQACLNVADLCENEPTKENILAASNAAAYAVAAAYAAAYAAFAAAAAFAVAAAYAIDAADAIDAAAAFAVAAAYAIDAADAIDAVAAAADAAICYETADAAANPDRYLKLLASLALEVLIELDSPGAKWINFNNPSSGLVG